MGSNNIINIDVRIIAATNKNISAMVENNQFREDLFYRLNVVPLVLPSLRERKADIAVLAQYFADEFSVSYQRAPQNCPMTLLIAFMPGTGRGTFANYATSSNTFCDARRSRWDQRQPSAPYLLSPADSRKTTMTAQPRQLAIQGKQAERDAIENAIQRFGSSVEGKNRLHQNWESVLPRSIEK